MPTVLVADDSPHIRRAVRQDLEAAGVEVAEAVDGIDAIEKAPDVRPDLVILDVAMPRLNGLDAARTIRARRPRSGTTGRRQCGGNER
jgi:CheY-like chemotaxis protein